MNDTEPIFDRIRSATADVTRQARYVHLADAQVAPYAASLAAAGLPALTYDADHHALGSEADVVAFQLALDTVNFGSGYFPHLRKRPGMSGYHTVAASLKDRWEGDGPLTATDLRAIQPEDCAVLFGQEGNDGPARELMALFAQAFTDLGAWLGRRYD
ncbi:MAG: queuosine 5'-phosphate N-glycosylase/hydrolase, partial [Thermomicrobiales bacterium]